MARPRKYFFFRFDEFPSRAPEYPVTVGDTIRVLDAYIGLRQETHTLYNVVKIHPRKGGVTVVKV